MGVGAAACQSALREAEDACLCFRLQNDPQLKKMSPRPANSSEHVGLPAAAEQERLRKNSALPDESLILGAD